MILAAILDINNWPLGESDCILRSESEEKEE